VAGSDGVQVLEQRFRHSVDDIFRNIFAHNHYGLHRYGLHVLGLPAVGIGWDNFGREEGELIDDREALNSVNGNEGHFLQRQDIHDAGVGGARRKDEAVDQTVFEVVDRFGVGNKKRSRIVVSKIEEREYLTAVSFVAAAGSAYRYSFP
jgi:hypothetical protein